MEKMKEYTLAGLNIEYDMWTTLLSLDDKFFNYHACSYLFEKKFDFFDLTVPIRETLEFVLRTK